MGNLIDGILNLSPFWLLLIAGLLVFAEDAIFIGFVIPGETAAVLAGAATVIGEVPLPAAIVVVVAAAIIGDSVGYEVGRLFLGRLLETRYVQKQQARIDGAQDFLRRRGGPAVFLGRFTAFFRAMMPALAGASRMPYRTFLFWNALGGIIWGTGFVLLGHLAGRSYHVVEKQAGRGVAIAFVVGVVVLVVIWRRTRERPTEE